MLEAMKIVRIPEIHSLTLKINCSHHAKYDLLHTSFALQTFFLCLDLDQPRQSASLHRYQTVGLHQRGQDSHPTDLGHDGSQVEHHCHGGGNGKEISRKILQKIHDSRKFKIEGESDLVGMWSRLKTY